MLRSRIKVGIAAAAAAVCLILPATAAADSCDGATDAIVTEDDLAPAERTLLCMLNVHRAGVGQSLRMETTLLFAARSHSADMVARNFFGHSPPEGTTPRQRATDAGYPEGFAVGEVLAATDDPTPAALWSQLTADPTAAELVRRPGFATSGVGLALGTPGGPGVTLTVMVGVADTDAEDTAVDLLTRTDCEPLTARLQLVDARFGRKDHAVTKAAREVKRLERAGKGGDQLRKAKRKLKRKRKVRDRVGKALELTYGAAEAACNPKKFHTKSN